MDEFNKTPLNRREYITANDPRDIIDLYGKKTLIDAKKQDTQKGFVEYHAVVVASTVTGIPKNTSFFQNFLNRFSGDKSSSPESEIGEMELIVAYIVGPESKNSGRAELPHDNIPPPCSLINNIRGLDNKTNLSLSLLQKLGTFYVAPNVEVPPIGTKVRVNFSQMPTSGVMRGGVYIGPITSTEITTEMDKKITQKCIGIKTNSLDRFISSFQLKRRGRGDKFFTIPSTGLSVHLDGGYPGTCEYCGSCFEEVTKKVENLNAKKFGIANTARSKASKSTTSPTAELAATIISMYLPEGAVFTSGVRVAQDQQNILLGRLDDVINNDSATQADKDKANDAKAAYEKATDGMTAQQKANYAGQELKDVFDQLTTEYKLGLVGAPRVHSTGGHGNLVDGQSYAIDISGAPLDCIIKSVSLARQDFGTFINFSNVIREAENNAVHVDFFITENGKKLREDFRMVPQGTLRKIKEAHSDSGDPQATLLEKVKDRNARTLDFRPPLPSLGTSTPSGPLQTPATPVINPAAPSAAPELDLSDPGAGEGNMSRLNPPSTNRYGY